MVAALGLLVPLPGVITLFGIPLTTAVGGLTLAGIGVNLAGSLLLSTASSALLSPDLPEAVRPENIQTNSKVATGPRTRHYGTVKVGGIVVFHRAREGKSYRVIVHGHGEVSNVLTHYLNDEEVAIDGAGFVTDDQYQHGGRSRVQMSGRMGVVPETHYSQITDVWEEWTVDHRLDGLWSSLIICESVPPENYRGMYPNNEPDLAVLAESTKCFDPRTGQTVFTENMALAIRDYVASRDGLNRPDAFEDQDISVQADICDVDVLLADGGIEPMYRIGGSYLLNEQPQTVLGRMLAACAGRIRLKASGKVALKVGVWSDPEFTLTYEDILEVQEVNSGPDLLDRYNELPARFNSQDLGYIEVDAEPWLDEARVADDGDVMTGPEKNLIMCPSHRQARQVMKIAMERDNPKQEVKLLCKPRALPAIYEDIIELSAPQLALLGNYEVSSFSLMFEKGLLKAVGMTLRRVDSAAFNLLLSEQGEVQQLPEPDTDSGVPLPQNVRAAGSGIRFDQNSISGGVAIAWEEPPSDSLSPTLKLRESGEQDWLSASAISNSPTSSTILTLLAGLAIDVSIAFVTPSGVVGDPVIITNVISSTDIDPPAPPTNLVISDLGGGMARVEVTTSISITLWKTEIYRDAVLVGVVYADSDTQISFIDGSGAGTFDWTARSVSVSSTKSTSDAGPVTATIA